MNEFFYAFLPFLDVGVNVYLGTPNIHVSFKSENQA